MAALVGVMRAIRRERREDWRFMPATCCRVTADERALKEIASEMDISLRMLQKHLTSIYKKTDTQTRAGLTKKFLT